MYKIFILTLSFVLYSWQAKTQCNPFIKVISGCVSSHTLGIKADGTLWAWGDNDDGQLGDGTNDNKNTPTQIGSATNWVSIAAGEFHSLAIKADGTLWAWGYNYKGQLGDGTNVGKNTPTQIGYATNWVSIAAGGDRSLAIKSDGTIWAWGDNYNGQLGDGTNVDKNTPTPIGFDTNWVSIAAGDRHSLALKADGTLWAWGKNDIGQLGDNTYDDKNTPTQIGSATNWVRFAAGGSHSLAIQADGTLWAWGNNIEGQLGNGSFIHRNNPQQLNTATNWTSIIAGQYHTIAMKADGTLWAWGRNVYGQLGDSTTIQKNIPIQIGTTTSWRGINAGANHSLAFNANGTLWAWGANNNGELGDSTNSNKITPTQLDTPPFYILANTNYTTSQTQGQNTIYANGCNLIASVSSSLASPNLISGGVTAKVWVQTAQPANYVKRHHEIIPATNASMVTGRVTLYFTQQDFNDFNSLSPYDLPTGFNDTSGKAILRIERYSGISSDGSGLPGTYSGIPIIINPADNDIVWNTITSQWEVSFNVTGFGGFFVKTQYETQTQCTPFKTVSTSASGGSHNLGIKTDGTLWAWGFNNSGQLGEGTNISRNTPTQVGTSFNWHKIATGSSHSLAIKTDGTLWEWGSTIGQNTPTQIGTSFDWLKITAGTAFSLAIKTDSTLWAWGFNGFGQLGDGTTINKNSPTQIGMAINWVNIASGEGHSLAIKADGTLWAWGKNSNGQLGDGSTIAKNAPIQIGTSTNWVSIAAGRDHSLALKADGTLWAWGSNVYGQLGDGTTINKNIPTQIGIAINWVNIAVGAYHSYAIKADGTLWAWGRNASGQLGDGTITNRNSPTQIGIVKNWASIAGGQAHSLATQTAGTLFTWGGNGFGQLGNGTNIGSNTSPSLIDETPYYQLSANTTSITQQLGNHTIFATGCSFLIASVNSAIATLNPISGSVTAKVWVQTPQPTNYVKRHYEITPATNAVTATGKVTLYFTQHEFNDFNAISSVDLPTSPGDAAGKANLVIEKRLGTSSDGSGLPGTYTGTPIIIDPVDADVVWNAYASRWEVSFMVSGFGGFFIKTLPPPAVSRRRGNALLLNGINQDVQCTNIPQLSGASKLTYEAWIKVTGGWKDYAMILSKEINPQTGFGNNRIQLVLSGGGQGGTNDLIAIVSDNNTGNNANYNTNSDVIPLNTWCHVAMVYDGALTGDANRLKIFVNGVQQTGLQYAGTGVVPATTGTNTEPLYIGSRAGTLNFRGEIEEVRVWNTARTQGEIRDKMHITLSGTETGLLSYYQFNETTGNVTEPINNYIGTLRNGATRSTSNLSVGGGTSTRMLITAVGSYDFIGTDCKLNFSGTIPNGEVVVYKLDSTAAGTQPIGNSIYDKHYWVINNYGVNTGLTVTPEFTLGPGKISAADAAIPSTLKLNKRPTNSLAAFTQVDANVAHASTGVITFNSINSFSEFAISTIGTSVLPIKLLSFTGQIQGSSSLLNWEMAETENDLRYELQRSLDGINFITINTQLGNANDKRFSYTDNNMVAENNYYRIKITSATGKITFSNVLLIKSTNNNSNISVYPNPVKEMLQVSGVKIGSLLLLTDISGKTLLRITATQNTFGVNMSNYASGVYFLKNENGIIKKIIKE